MISLFLSVATPRAVSALEREMRFLDEDLE
jgi:hypothetical protein